MNRQRAQAYGRVVRTLDDLGGATLHPGEVQVVREAADELLFCRDFESTPSAEGALTSVYELVDDLTSRGRLIDETARGLVADVEACGQFEADAQAAA